MGNTPSAAVGDPTVVVAPTEPVLEVETLFPVDEQPEAEYDVSEVAGESEPRREPDLSAAEIVRILEGGSRSSTMTPSRTRQCSGWSMCPSDQRRSRWSRVLLT